MDTTMILKRREIAGASTLARGCTLLGTVIAVTLSGGCSTQTPPAKLQEAPAVNNIAAEPSHGQQTQAAVETPPPVTVKEPEPREKMVHFHFDSSLVGPDARGVLKKQVDYLTKNPQLSVILEGYADERGPDGYNLKLGLQRAVSVAFVLKQNGIPKKRIRLVSYGERKPLETGHTETAWRANRRVEFHYVPDSEVVSALPGTGAQ
jgi:peptidoglycan-associated lipoprotein